MFDDFDTQIQSDEFAREYEDYLAREYEDYLAREYEDYLAYCAEMEGDSNG